ncbi:hypothetical protein B0H34DRAFT_702293 [Crassisporium funariophilum]|nr:hypothetical protein B0H34DRAFT_702293 [Crassisporium funariophilum]
MLLHHFLSMILLAVVPLAALSPGSKLPKVVDSFILPRVDQVCSVGCPKGYFACPIDYYGDCCPDGSFCGTDGNNSVCYT